MFRHLSLACLALALTACGKSTEEPLEQAPVAELRGPWLMVNRAADCAHYYTMFSPGGIFRVREDKSPRKQYAAISKFLLEPGKVTFAVSGVEAGHAEIASMTFSLTQGKLRLIELLGPKGGSFKAPPETLPQGEQDYLKNVYRLNEQHFAMDRCTAS